MIAANKIGLLVGVGLLCLTGVRAQDTLQRKPMPLIDTLAIREKKEKVCVLRSNPELLPQRTGVYYGRSHAQEGTLYIIDTTSFKKPNFFRKTKWFIKRIFN